jgi:superfamily I DNA/RNA helicase
MQDVSSAALELFLKFTDENTRILGVGDRWQSIMGFAGANTDALDRLKYRTNAISLPLSICYRCPKSHLKLAQKLVPSIEASPTAIEGVIIDIDLKVNMAGHYDYEELLPHLTGGELIVCRKTAPLISLCIKLIIARIPAKIIAGDSNLEQSLSSLIDDISKVSGFRFERFPEFVEILFQSRQSRLIEQGAFKIIANLRDRCDALLACFEGFDNLVNIKSLKKSLSNLFLERQDSVTLSTIHTAKGLEAERVVFLHPELCPHTFKGQNKESLQQEKNLQYVALTRSKRTLILACSGGVKKPQSKKTDDCPKDCQKSKEEELDS